MSNETKTTDVIAVEETAKVVEETAKVTPPAVDQRALKLASDSENAIAASAQAEADIAASQTLEVYAKAGRAHHESIKLGKAEIDYSCEKRGVPSIWTGSDYDTVIDTITRRVRAMNPELFMDFDAIKEDGKTPKASNSSERIHTRILVACVADALVALISDKVWKLPYRLVANYLRAERIYTFNKKDVSGALRPENAEFLKINLQRVADGGMTSKEFLIALQNHYAAIDKATVDAANAHLTPQEREVKAKASAAGAKAAKKEQDVGSVRKSLSRDLATALSGVLPPADVADMVRDAAKAAKVSLPIGKMNPKTITPSELGSFLEQVITQGGATQEERKKLRQVIMRYGSELDQKRRAAIEKNAQKNGQRVAVSAN